MLKTSVRRQLIYISSVSSLIGLFWVSTRGHAAILIPTNLGVGADAEVREDPDNHMRPGTPATDPAWSAPGAPRGRNRGGINGSTLVGGDLSVADAGGQELATRIRDLTSNPANDRTSAMYLKFDISGLTLSDLNTYRNVKLRLTVRNTNLNWSRIHALNPYYGSLPANDTNPEWVAFRNDLSNWTRVKFNLYGLKPEPLDPSDPRRFGNPDPTLPVPNYDWIENPSINGDPFPEGGTNTAEPVSNDETTWDPVRSPLIGPIGPITWYNAPGITPDSRTTPLQDAGKFNFNSDVELLGDFTLPNPPGAGPPIPDGGARLPVGMPFFYTEQNEGNLYNLIKRAIMEGRSTVTLAVAIGVDGLQNSTGETLQTTPSSFLNFNYLVNSKEKTTLENDTNWDPDGAGPLPPTGSPYSCLHATNCPGSTLGDNSTGWFSPTLVFMVPEPGSFLLACLGMLATAATVRRRQQL